MNFYSKFINKLHISLKPFYTLLYDDILFEWTPDLDKLFNQIKLSLSKDAELNIPNTTHPFYITVDASLVGLGAVLFQPNSKKIANNFLKFAYFNNPRTKTFYL